MKHNTACNHFISLPRESECCAYGSPTLQRVPKELPLSGHPAPPSGQATVKKDFSQKNMELGLSCLHIIAYTARHSVSFQQN